MKLTIERAALLRALGHVQSAVERRNTIPILSNVLLSAERDKLTFSATDLDLEIIDEALAQVDQPGQITAPAHTLYEIVRKLPEGADVSLAFTGDDPRLTVAAGRSRFNLPVLPAGDFPVMSSEGFAGAMDVDVNDLIRLIDKTRFAISAEETRYYLNGLYVHTVIVDGSPRLRAVATDGSRLALADMPAPEGAAGAPGVIVPRKTIGEVRRLLDYVGLPFEPACLEFYNNDRAVRTASSEQVRRPIFTDAVEHWKHYEPWLGPLSEALGPVIDAYPDPPERGALNPNSPLGRV